MVEKYRAGLDALARTPCTLLVTPHPSASGMRDRMLRDELVEQDGCTRYAEGIESRLQQRLDRERNR